MIAVKPSPTAMTLARWIVKKPIFEPEPVYRWAAANNTKRPPSGKNRDKVKAARKQRNRK